jgi:hypothetical protein
MGLVTGRGRLHGWRASVGKLAVEGTAHAFFVTSGKQPSSAVTSGFLAGAALLLLLAGQVDEEASPRVA